MERRAELFEAPEMGEIVELKLVEPLPETCYVGALYTLEGTVKLFGIGALPWVYVEVKKKEWAKPEAFEEVSYERGLPKPISGKFSIDLTFDKVGSYEVTVVATPAPLSLPLVGVAPVVGRSDKMEIDVEEPPPPAFRFASATIDGQMISLVDHDADSGLLMRKSTADYLEIMPAFEWTGVRKKATISVKAGFKDYLGTFAPKTGAFTKSFTLPDSPFVPYEGELGESIKVPLTACGDIDDGAIEIVAKLPDMPDYITHIWNVYATKIEKDFRFAGVKVDGQLVPLTDHDADSGLLLKKTTADHLEINPVLEWKGPAQRATISIKAGYKDWAGGFTPKTGAYTRTITLPESPEAAYESELETPISIPLVACGGLTDGAIEIVLKIADFPDYISQIWNVYATKVPPEDLGFDLTRPSVSETPVEPGTAIDITCPITSRCAMPVDARAKVIIYEGSIMAGHGDKIKEYDSIVFHIEPNAGKDVIIHHTTVEGSIDRRDVEVEVYIDTQLVKQSEWDDVFYVGVPPEEVVDFDLTRPSVSPAEITPGTEITLTCPVTSVCTKEQTATAKVKIYEGSFYAGHGRLITTKTSPAFTISPEQTYGVIVHHTTIAGDIDRRDVEVEVYVGGKLVKQSEWDDVYYVQQIVLNTLEVDITPSEGGYVTTEPMATEGHPEARWYNNDTGKFESDTRVRVTAHPNEGYEFDHWSDEIEGGTSTSNPEYVAGTMTSHKAVKAHFKEIALGTLEVDITPTEGGYVTTNPAPVTGPSKWYNGSTGQFNYGTRVQVTAHPNPGYEFEHWSDEIEGGVSYENPAYVSGTMTSHKAVKAHFKKIITYTLTVNINPSGGGSVTKSPSKTAYTEGESVSLTAKPASGYEFDHWGGDASGSSTTVSLYMNSNKSVTAYFNLIKTYTLSVRAEPSEGGGVTASPSKTAYVTGERVTLTATPYSGYEFDKWSGDASGYSPTTTIYMDKDKSVVANFKEAVPDPTTKVSFIVKGDGFPFLTRYWKLYHYDRDENVWQDYALHNPGDIINVRNVQSAGRLSCHCCSSVTGEWSEQYYSVEFAAIDGEDYEYDIASGIVYYR